MKTITRLATIWAIAGLTVSSLTAQQIVPQPVPGNPQPKNGGPKNNINNPGPKNGGGKNDKWWISVGVGGGPNYGPPPPNYGPYYGGGYYGGGYGYYNNYPNYYGGGYYNMHYRKAARRMIRNTAYVIYNAIQQANWEGMYNPVLSNAVGHQQHAKYLYNVGDYMGALYHSKRANYLAWQALNFNYGTIPNPGYDGWDDDLYGNGYDGDGYNDGGYYDGSKQNGNNGANKQKAPSNEPGKKVPSNEELDKKIQKKEMTKDEMKGMKLQDLDLK